ncbi:DUF6233 domain-containing protein [Streptomyces xanthochromogenes]|uniref:DUF6233 domain-containing protein n=1 Tax=Streptomyces xanthochromogenes TaxID=67384 RepID=UPI003413D2FE
MSEPSRLDQLHFLRRFLLQELARVDGWIKKEEERQAAEVRRTPPPTPDWVIAYQRRGAGPVADGVHVGDCHMATGRTQAATREQAVRALTVGAVPACPYCRPDSELGVLE